MCSVRKGKIGRGTRDELLGGYYRTVPFGGDGVITRDHTDRTVPSTALKHVCRHEMRMSKIVKSCLSSLRQKYPMPAANLTVPLGVDGSDCICTIWQCVRMDLRQEPCDNDLK